MLAVELDHRLIEQGKRIGRVRERRNCCDCMKGCGDRDAGSPNMGDRCDTIALRQRQDVEPTRKPARDSKIRLEDVDATSTDQIANP